MPSLYGAGYGAGKIFEGATSGALRGNLLNREYQQQDIRNQQVNRRLNLSERQIANQETNVLNEQQQNEIRRRSTAFAKAFEVASKAAPGTRRKTYDTVYKSLYPEGTPPPIEFDESGENVSLTLEDGSKIVGPSRSIAIASRAIATNPADAPNVIKAMIQSPDSGVRYEQVGGGKGQKQNLATVTGYDAQGNKQTIFVEKTPGAAQLPPGMTETEPAGGPKLTDYSRAIADVLKKYQVGSGVTVNPDGSYNIESLLAGRPGAYQELTKRANAGDQEAANDLRLLQGWYAQIEAQLPGGAQPAQTNSDPLGIR